MNKKKELTYQEAIDEVEVILSQFESDACSIDDLMQQVERATFLLKFCRTKLHKTDQEITKLFQEVEIEG